MSGALEIVQQLADVEVKRSGVLMHVTTIKGERPEVLAAGRILQIRIGESVSKI